VGEQRLRDADEPHDVGLPDLLQPCLGQLSDLLEAHCDAGVVDQHIGAIDRGGEAINGTRIGDVELYRPPAALRRYLPESFHPACPQNDIEALLGEPKRGGLADAARSSGDDGGASATRGDRGHGKDRCTDLVGGVVLFVPAGTPPWAPVLKAKGVRRGGLLEFLVDERAACPGW